jgi:haloalkane dehalogenase
VVVEQALLHGNPSSSHTWRNVVPGMGEGRLLAPDLIGMGRSGKPDIPYGFADHARYLDAWFDAMGLDRVILVGHDWGGALAFDWASRHPGRVLGIAFFEAIVRPMAWEDLSPQARRRSEMVLAPAGEEQLLGEDVVLVKTAYTGGVLHPVGDADLEAYLAPTRPGRAGGRCWPGRGSSRWAADPPTWSRVSRRTTHGSPPAPRCPSCS